MRNAIFPLSIVSGIVTAFLVGSATGGFFVYTIVLATIVGAVWLHFFTLRFLLIVLLVLIGFARGMLALPQDVAEELRTFSGAGVVVRAPIVRAASQTLTVRSDATNAELRVTTGIYPPYRYGDWLSLDCPKIKEGICFFPTVHVLGEDKGNAFFATLFTIKDYLAAQIGSVLPEPHASFAAALLLGERAAMPKALTDAFQITGTTHIVAVSGMHIVILAGVIEALFHFLPFSATTRRSATAILLLFFTAMIGAPASAVRGLLFGLLFMFTEAVGRPRAMTMVIVATAALLLFAHPLFLFDLGFQLSFLAIVGIVYGVPILAHVFRSRIPTHWFWRGVAVVVMTTVAATIATAPLLAGVFGRVSLLGIFANVLIIPLIAYATIATLLVALLAALHPLIALPVGFVLFALLQSVLWIVERFASFGGAAVAVLPPSPFILFALYSLLFIPLFIFWLRLSPWERIHSLEPIPLSS